MTLAVVSFYAPRPEHPFFQDYRPFLNLLRLSCARFGHNHLVLTDDPFEIGADDAYTVELPRSLMKAFLAAQFAYLSDPANAETPTLFVGADCVLANDPAAHFPYDCDLAITVGPFLDCRMNTGAIFIPRPRRVAEIWGEALAHVGDDWGDDQTSLYRAILDRPWHGHWTALVKELPVDPFNLAPEHPSDDCTRGVVLHFRGPRKQWMLDYCKNWLDLGDGIQVKMTANTIGTDVMANVRTNSARELPVIEDTQPHDGHAVLVGGGPSLESTLPEIIWRQQHGQTIFALNGAAKWLDDHGVIADYTVILDSRASNAAFVGNANAYLLASQCAPEVFEAAAGQPVTMWHFVEPGVERIVRSGCLVGGGITVGLTAMGLAHAMGYRQLHLYGYDSSDADGAGHAYAQSENSAEAKRLEVWCAGHWFTCGAAMYAQANEFPAWACALAEAGHVITVHGDGLLPTVARHMNAAAPIQGALAA